MKIKVAIGLIFICFLTGCESTNTECKGNTSYFRTISSETHGRVVYDERTGVEYWISYGYSNVLTVLVDADGNPLIYDRSAKE
jgi:hypothetical protein